MKVISIDNCYEEDGIANLFSALSALNNQPNGPMRDQLVAILPEYRDGRLDRLNVLTVPAEDPGLLTGNQMDLMTAAAEEVSRIQARRAAAQTPSEPTVQMGAPKTNG